MLSVWLRYAVISLVFLALLIVALASPLATLLLILGLGSLDRSPLFAFVWVPSLVIGWSALALLTTMVVLMMAQRKLSGASQPLGPVLAVEPDGERPLPDRLVVALVAYNEAEAIQAVVEDFRRQPGVAQVLVVDNNSSDGTAELARQAGARVIHEASQGYGYACMRGLREALKVPGATALVLAEADGTFVGRDLAKFRAYSHQADLVLGNRVSAVMVEPGSQMDCFFTWGNIAVALLLRLRYWNAQHLGVAPLSDVGCTYRLITRRALERIEPLLSVGGHHFSVHMMLVALEQGLRVVEIPVTFRRRVGQSKGASQSFFKGLQVGLTMIWHIITHAPCSSVLTPAVAQADRQRSLKPSRVWRRAHPTHTGRPTHTLRVRQPATVAPEAGEE